MNYITEFTIGSKWAGDDSDPLDVLFDTLGKYALDRRWEDSMIQDKPEWVKFVPSTSGYLGHLVPSGNPYPGHTVTIFTGNFLTISCGFRIVTDDPELIAKLRIAIHKNQTRNDYKSQKIK